MSKQNYLGNGQHQWEKVADQNGRVHFDMTERLRVPGGWLYRNTLGKLGQGSENAIINVTFVPMPEVVKHKV